MPILILCCLVTSQLLFLFLNFNLLHVILNSMSIHFIIICSMLSSCLLFLFRFLSFVMCVSSCFFNVCLIMASLILTILAFVTLSFYLKFCNPTSYILSRFIYLPLFVFHVLCYLMSHYYTRGRPTKEKSYPVFGCFFVLCRTSNFSPANFRPMLSAYGF
jgi:hypothetical protein